MSPVATSHAGRPARAPGRRRSRRTGPTASRRSCARRSTWARARSRWCAGTRDGRARFGAPGRLGRLDPDRPAVLRADLRPPVDRLARRRRGGLWTSWTDWLLLDAELLPWRPRPELLRASTPRSAPRPARCRQRRALDAAVAGSTSATCSHGAARADASVRRAYRRYCWPTDGLAGCGRAVPGAGRRDARPRPRTPGTWARRPAGRRRPGLSPTRRLVVTADPTRSRRRPPGGRS